MTTKVVVFERANSLEGAASWHLVVREDGSRWIEHSWRRRTGEADDNGSDMVKAEHFMETCQDSELLKRVRAALSQVGVTRLADV
jgi:hypothetical protein